MLKHQPDFIIEAGDLIEAGDGAKPELREEQCDNFRTVRDDAQHEIPMYAAIGNHDDPENIAEVTFEDIFPIGEMNGIILLIMDFLISLLSIHWKQITN